MGCLVQRGAVSPSCRAQLGWEAPDSGHHLLGHSLWSSDLQRLVPGHPCNKAAWELMILRSSSPPPISPSQKLQSKSFDHYLHGTDEDKAWSIYWTVSSFLLQHHLGLNFPAHFEVSIKYQTLVTDLNLKSLVHIHLQSFRCFMHKTSIAPKAQIVTRSAPIHRGVRFSTA